MLGLTGLDWAVIAIYLLSITAIGVWTIRKIRSAGDYFMGNRGFGKVLMIAQAFGVGTHTDQPVSVSGAASTTGLAGIWYQWLWMFTTPFFWIISPIYRRLRYVTMADFYEERYGKGLAIAYTIVGMLFFSMQMGVMLKGTGVTIEGLTGGAMPEKATILVATALFVTYGVAGGLVAAAITDLIQGVLILVLSFMMVPFALNAAGGYHAIRTALPESMFSLVAPVEVTGFFIAMAVLNGLVGIVVQPHHMAIGGAGKSEIASRAGWTYGTFLKRIATMGWAFTGIFAAFLLPLWGYELTQETREFSFGIMARELLPTGFVGLMLAAMLAAVMSTCDAFMVHGSALFTQNIYKSYMKPEATDKDRLRVARISGAVIVAGGLLFAYGFESVIQGIVEAWKVTAYLGLAFWLGIIWKRTNRWGAISSAVVMATAAIVTTSVLHWSLPNQIALYIPLGLVTIIVVSMLTPPEPEKKLRDFYLLLDTPVGEEQRLKDAGVEIKLEGKSLAKKKSELKKSAIEGVFEQEVDDGLILVDLLHLKERWSWKRYRTDILGWLVAAGLVGLLILLAKVLAG